MPRIVRGRQTRSNPDVTCLSEILSAKRSHLLPASDDLESELHRWKQHCSGIMEDKSLSHLLCEDADPIFFPNNY